MTYGQEDTSYKTAGQEAGLRQLVEDFYHEMATQPSAAKIKALHPKDIETTIDKLSRFLCGWLGGPKLYRERYGQIRIPMAHSHLPLGIAERDAWMLCMSNAVAKQAAWPQDFKEYFLREIFVPAERSRNQD